MMRFDTTLLVSLSLQGFRLHELERVGRKLFFALIHASPDLGRRTTTAPTKQAIV
jgi:hypothetical protein